MSNSSGYSQQGPADSADEWLSRQFQIGQTLSRVRTIVIAQVTAVQGGGGAIAGSKDTTVTVKPLVKIIDGQGNVSSHGTIQNVPIFRLGGGSSAVICDPVVDDIGFLAIADRDSSLVKKNQEESPPGSRRKFDLADAVYLGSLFSGVPTQYIAFTENGVKVKSSSDGIDLNGLKINTSGQIDGPLPVNGNLELGGSIENLSGGTYSGNISTSGDVVAGTISLKTHHHSGVTTGGGNSGPPF